MARAEHDLTDQQWSALEVAWGGCAYCGANDEPLQRDCVQAVSRGGRYTLANVVPACRSCNASKCGHEVTSWMRRKRLDERTFLERHLEIHRSLTDVGRARDRADLGGDDTTGGLAEPVDHPLDRRVADTEDLAESR